MIFILYTKGEKLECNIERQCKFCEWHSTLSQCKSNGIVDHIQHICKAEMCSPITDVTTTTRCRKFTKYDTRLSEYEHRAQRYDPSKK